MPHSLRQNDQMVLDFVKHNSIRQILDVGVGCGTYAHLLGGRVSRIDAIEVWRPYVQQYDLDRLYDAVYVGDVRDISKSNDWNLSYDLIIFGDVLEHMTLDEAKVVWGWAHRVATYGLISVPVVHWPQEGTENPYEAHVQEHITVDDIQSHFGPFQDWASFGETATFIRRFRG